MPIKLPDTSVLKPSDASRTAIVEWVLNAGTDPAPISDLDVEFPTAEVNYRLTDSSEPANAIDEYQAQIAETPTNAAPPSYQIVSLRSTTSSPRGRHARELDPALTDGTRLPPAQVTFPRTGAGECYSDSMSARSSSSFSPRSSSSSPRSIRDRSARTSDASSSGLNGFVT